MFRNVNPVLPPTEATMVDAASISSAVKKGEIHAVDQFGVEDFALNDCGFPVNTIGMLSRCETLAQYNMIAQRLSKTNVANPDLSKLSLDDQFALGRPRSCQLPHEVDAYAQTIAKIDMRRLKEQYLKNARSTESNPSVDSHETSETDK